MNKSHYRSDIDGLRAIAVLMVVVFHAFPDALTGGFAGVDVFFVISGYLITGALRNGLDLPYHGIKRFYMHRARRLFPALIVVCLSVIATGWLVLLPDEYAQLGRHLVAGGLFFENFLLLTETGYFDVDAELKPLMHFWSLSVEEQFYLIFPLAIILGAKHKLKLQNTVVALLLISLAVSAWYAWQSPAEGYFMPQSRFWEILTGSLLQCLLQPTPDSTQPSTEPRSPSASISLNWNLIALAGVVMITVSGALITPLSPFPFPWAILPVAGSALVIWAGQRAWINRAVLGSRPFVAIGLISYPLYLWHWPILSYLNILTSGQASDVARGAAVLLAVTLAWATYAWIEKPLRYRWSSRHAPSVLAAGMLLVVLLGAYIDHRKGMNFRMASRINAMSGETSHGALRLLGASPHLAPGCGVQDEQLARTLAHCLHDTREEPTVALIGDSKSEALAGGLLSSSQAGYRFLYLGGTNTQGAVVPVISDAPLYRNYQPLAKASLDALSQNQSIRVVVLTVATRALFQLKSDDSIEDLPTSPHFDVAYEGLNAGVSQLVRHGKKVVLVVDNPTLPDPKKCIGRVTGQGWLDRALGLGTGSGCSIDLRKQVELSKPYTEMLKRIAANHPRSVTIFDTLPALCDTQSGKCSSFKGGKLLYAYTDHISDHGSEVISRSLVPFIQELDQRP